MFYQPKSKNSYDVTNAFELKNKLVGLKDFGDDYELFMKFYTVTIIDSN